MNVVDTRNAIADGFTTSLADVQVYARVPGAVAAKVALVVRRGEYDVADYMGQGDPDVPWELIVLASMADSSNLDVLDETIEQVLEAIEADPTLHGFVASVVATKVTAEDIITIGSQSYYGSTIDIEVLA